MSSLTMNSQGDALNVYYKIKEAKLKRLHAVSFQLCDMTFWKDKTVETVKG